MNGPPRTYPPLGILVDLYFRTPYYPSFRFHLVIKGEKRSQGVIMTSWWRHSSVFSTFLKTSFLTCIEWILFHFLDCLCFNYSIICFGNFGGHLMTSSPPKYPQIPKNSIFNDFSSFFTIYVISVIFHRWINLTHKKRVKQCLGVTDDVIGGPLL